MGNLKSISFDFRNLIYVDRAIYKNPLIPSVLWLSLEKTPIERWRLLLRPLRSSFTYEYTDEHEHTVLGEYDEDAAISKVHALISNVDTRHNLIFQTIQTLMHEYIHASQSNCNSEYYNTIEEGTEYLAEWREIQALSHCAYLEIMEYDDRPTRTVDWYSAAPTKVKKDFYKYIYRWYKKYQIEKKLNI